jgi:predicted extracellular nuclease
MGTSVMPTMVTIPTIRDPGATGHPATGSVVMTTGIVTAVKNLGTSRSFIIQDPTATAWAGIQVFTGSTAVTVARGDNVAVSGTYTSFRGMDQIDVRSGTYMAMGTGTIPTPIAVTNADIVTGGPHARDYQSMLVTVSGVTASSATSGTDFTAQPAGMCMTAGGLIVTSVYANDLMPSPFPATMCQTYTSITGVVYSFGPTAGPFDSKLAPRDTADVVSP